MTAAAIQTALLPEIFVDDTTIGGDGARTSPLTALPPPAGTVSVVTDGVTITGNGTTGAPLVAVGGAASLSPAYRGLSAPVTRAPLAGGLALTIDFDDVDLPVIPSGALAICTIVTPCILSNNGSGAPVITGCQITAIEQPSGLTRATSFFTSTPIADSQGVQTSLAMICSIVGTGDPKSLQIFFSNTGPTLDITLDQVFITDSIQIAVSFG